MKKTIKLIALLLCLAMLITLAQIPNVFAENEGKTATILFTSDMHSNLLPSTYGSGDDAVELGGYARLKTAIDEEKKLKPDALLLDGGDYSMGTLFQTIYTSAAPDLRIMGLMGYDATTVGNHEFDFRGEGYAKSLNRAKMSGENLPAIVLSNYSYPQNKDGTMDETISNIKKAMEDYPVKDYIVIERGGCKIGIFGLMGISATEYAPMSDIEFTDRIENAKRVVKILKEQEKVDLVVCLSHCGLNLYDTTKSEDEVLAKNAPDIDIIISGHTHTTLNTPIISGNTVIVACGEYGHNLGILNINQNEQKKWEVDGYKLKQITDDLTEDPQIKEVVNNYKHAVETDYLDKFNLKFDQVLAHSDFDFTSYGGFGYTLSEETLGNLITDAYIYAIKKAEGENYEKIAVAILPRGIVRGTFGKGDITVSNVFNVNSLGVGADGTSGYPLISVYLTGKEIKTACEVDASISPLMGDAQLYMSGIGYTINPNRLIFNKVTKADLQNPDGSLEQIDDNKLYRVVTGLYSAQMLSVVGEKSYGLLSIVPKTKDGKEITDFEKQIIYDNSTGVKTELKEWLSIAQYLQSFEKVGDIPQVPEYYKTTHNRKLIDDNKNLFEILKNPNKITMVVYAIVILLFALIIFIIYRICTHKKRKARKAAKKAALKKEVEANEEIKV